MSYPVNLQALPGEVLQEVFTPENMRGRRSLSSLAQLTFPKSRSALWDGSPAGEKLRLQLCSHRNPRLVLLEKALRLAQRHARRCNKPRLQCFFLGSLSVNEDEEGITVTLDRFDPGRDQAGTADLVPSALLPGDVLVPCWFSPRSEADAVVQSEAELHQCFKALQQAVSGRQTLHLSQLLKVRGQVLCSQTSDAASFSLSWSAVCPAVCVDVQPVRAVPIIPTALLRSLTSVGRPAERAGRQRGFLTMDQTRKLVLLLESDPKASSLPLVGLWLSGVAHISNPQVWAWTLRFMFGAALQDRVLSEVGCFLLVVFASTHRTPQFFQCRQTQPGPSPGLDFQLLTATQSLTLYQQVAPVDGRALRCELGPEDRGRQAEVFRAAQSSFNGTAPPAAGPSVSDQDSGVEDEDFSPRPSPSPHPPAPQVRRVQPSVPELSLLIDSSFSSNHSGGPGSGSAHKAPPASPCCPGSTSSLAPAAPPQLHSTPNPDLQQPCSCCSSHAYGCTSIYPSPALPPAAAPHFHLQTPFGLRAAPPPSCSQQKASPPLASFHHYAPRRPSTPPPPSSHQQTAPPLSRHSAPLPPHPSAKRPATPPLPPASCQQQTPPLPPPSSLSSAPLQSSHKLTPPPSSRRSAPPFCSYKQTPPPSSLQSLSSHQPPAPPPPSNHPVLQPPPPPPPFLPSYPCSHAPPAPPWCGEPPSPHLSRPDPVSPPCGRRCCEKAGGGGLPSDAYQFLLHQDHLLRLLQAQVQMLLEAQGKLQSSGRQVETQTSKSTASVAVETGASLFWGQNPDPPLLQEERDPPPSPGSPPPSSSSGAASSHDPSAHRAQEVDAARQATPRPSSDMHSISGLQSPVLGESVSMYGPPEDQQNFYQNLMTQLNSRLQESDQNQEEAAEASRRQDRSGSDHSQVSHPSRRSSSSSSSSERRRTQRRKEKAGPEGDAVVRATLRRLQQLGVAVDAEDLTVLDKEQIQAVEMASTLASINPAAVVSRLSVAEPAAPSGGSALCPGGSVDLSLEANAIALRYLSQSQLSRLSLGGHAPQSVPVPASSSGESLLSPSNMSLATRKYMRRYGLIEEDEEDEEEEEEEVRRPLNVKLLPQSQLIRELRPKMQLLAGNGKADPEDKENRPARRTGAVRQPEASVGNILDLSRLRQLPKLF